MRCRVRELTMKRVVETYVCDMCGKEIDVSIDTPRRPIICSNVQKYIPVYEHNPTYDEGYQDGIGYACIDLCPDCAERACVIKYEWYEEDGRWHTKLSWRTHQSQCDEMSEGAKRIFDRMMNSANEESEFGRLKKAEGKERG